jgi:hypothetical protein
MDPLWLGRRRILVGALRSRFVLCAPGLYRRCLVLRILGFFLWLTGLIYIDYSVFVHRVQ